MDDDNLAQPTSSSENDSEFAALLEAELEKEDGWGSQEDEVEAGGSGSGVEEVDVEDIVDWGEDEADRNSVDESGGAKPDVVEPTFCPPHPGYMWNICIRCGNAKEEEDDEKGIALRYLHQGLELSEGEAARLRKDDLRKLLGQKKLYLVVDLDHTLLNSTRMIEVPESDTAYLRSAYSPTTVHPPSPAPSASSDDLLYELPPLQMWTKLRPFVREFLEEAAGMFEMYVYTMGEKLYAQAMARLLDPTGRLFGERVISQQDSTSRKTKDLDVVLGAESAVLIIDDTEAVWPKNRANLLVIERYHFFRSSRRQFGLPGESLVEARKDESSEEGALRGILGTLKKVHADFFDCGHGGADVRQVMQSVRSSILSGCHVVFSRIFPQGFPHHDAHPLWVRAIELGAQCSLSVSAETTHVVTVEPGTEKARWAKQEGKFVVRPEWLECCQLLWSRAKEEDFPVLQDRTAYKGVPEFARTVDRKEIKPPASENGTVDVLGDARTEVTKRERTVHLLGVTPSDVAQNDNIKEAQVADGRTSEGTKEATLDAGTASSATRANAADGEASVQKKQDKIVLGMEKVDCENLDVELANQSGKRQKHNPDLDK